MWVMHFKSTRVQTICPKLCWRWTAIANILARSVLSVKLQSHALQNFLPPGTRPARRSLASTLSLVADSKSSSIQCALFCFVLHCESWTFNSFGDTELEEKVQQVNQNSCKTWAQVAHVVQCWVLLKQVLKQKLLKLLGHTIRRSRSHLQRQVTFNLPEL